MDAFDRGPRRVVVGQRLTHAHEHDVGESPAGAMRFARGPHDLFDDLTRGQVTRETRLAGRAKAARHRAARLRRHAHRRPTWIVHEDRFDRGAARQFEQPLNRGAAVGLLPRHFAKRGLERGVGRQRSTQRLRHVAHVVDIGELGVQPVPHLPGPVGLLVRERGQGRQLLEGQVVPRHPPTLPESWRGPSRRTPSPRHQRWFGACRHLRRERRPGVECLVDPRRRSGRSLGLRCAFGGLCWSDRWRLLHGGGRIPIR